MHPWDRRSNGHIRTHPLMDKRGCICKKDEPAHLLHCYHGSLNKFTVTSDGKVPGSNPHQVIEGEFQDKTTIGTNLRKNTIDEISEIQTRILYTTTWPGLLVGQKARKSKEEQQTNLQTDKSTVTLLQLVF